MNAFYVNSSKWKGKRPWLREGHESDMNSFKLLPFSTILHNVDSILQKWLQHLPSCPSYNVILILFQLSSGLCIILPLNLNSSLWLLQSVAYGISDAIQPARLDHKSTMHFFLALWGHSLSEPSFHAIKKTKLDHMKKPYVGILANSHAESKPIGSIATRYVEWRCLQMIPASSH